MCVSNNLFEFLFVRLVFFTFLEFFLCSVKKCWLHYWKYVRVSQILWALLTDFYDKMLIIVIQLKILNKRADIRRKTKINNREIFLYSSHHEQNKNFQRKLASHYQVKPLTYNGNVKIMYRIRNLFKFEVTTVNKHVHTS